MTRANILQTTIVQLDIVVCTNKYTTACAVCFVFEILQIDVVSFLFATTEFHFRQIVDVFDLCQEEQTTHHGVYIERLTHIDITKARAEGRITCRGGILEIQISTAVDDDVTTCTGIHSQVTLISEIRQTPLGNLCSTWYCRSVFINILVFTAMAKAEDDTGVLVHHHRIYSTIVQETTAPSATAEIFIRERDSDVCVRRTIYRRLTLHLRDIDVTTTKTARIRLVLIARTNLQRLRVRIGCIFIVEKVVIVANVC